jgi:hypothetical protein
MYRWFGVALLIAGVSLPLAASQVSAGARARTGAVPGNAAVTGAPLSRAFLDQYCVTCHNEKSRTAKLALDTLDLDRVEAHAETWEKVVRKLRAGSMPPAGMPRPGKTEYNALATALEASLDRAASIHPNPGHPLVRRLNRVEYANVIHDLLALDVDTEALLPPDESASGFDNNADAQSLTPGLLDRYLIAAWKIGRLAVGDPAIQSTIETYRFPTPLVQNERMDDDLPFRSRGGAAIRHLFPVDGEYSIRMHLLRTWTSPVIRGLINREQLDVRIDGTRVRLFAVGGECVGSKESRCVRPPGIIPASDYEKNADDPLVVRVPVKAGMHVIGISFLTRIHPAFEGAGAELPPAGHPKFSYAEDVDMSIERVDVEGPLTVIAPGDSPSRRRIFVCDPGAESQGQRPESREPKADRESQCARTIVRTLARRAFRRPVVSADIDRLMTFYRDARERGTFDSGIEAAIERTLVSPEFLFRIERDPPAATPGHLYRIDDLGLASRLSFFLWSSIPDDELLAVATRGSLGQPAVLRAQVRRMLADPRASAFIRNFTGQWLLVRNIRSVAPDPGAFPEFDENLRVALETETTLFLDSQFREDRPVTDLLTAEYTFLNERLARHYGIPNVYGSHFRRVEVSDDRRAGLLGLGSILTVTSYSTRTSPVVRGKWLLENLLGTPPPPPPPNVPALKDNDASQPTSVRERLERHRRNPVCASCHSQMDPLGFALEHFNGIGRWRTMDGHSAIDATGKLPDGTTFASAADLRNALVAHQDQFVLTLTERLLTYALGRAVEYYDMPAVRTILRDARHDEYRWSSLVMGVISSVPFRMRVAAPSTVVESAEVMRMLQ